MRMLKGCQLRQEHAVSAERISQALKMRPPFFLFLFSCLHILLLNDRPEIFPFKCKIVAFAFALTSRLRPKWKQFKGQLIVSTKD